MNIVFFGNADFGCNTLTGLTKTNHTIVGVVTNKDAKSGRSQKYIPTPIKKTALDHNLSLLEVDDIRNKDFVKELNTLNADLFIVIAYKILPKTIYSLPKYGAINIHASLLPQYKGPSPIQEALINGDTQTGLSSFFIDQSIDGGNLIFQEEIDILDCDDFGSLWLKLATMSVSFTKKTIDMILSDEKKLLNKKTPESYAPKINKNQLKIDWGKDAVRVNNQVRAFSPYPCVFSFLNKKRIKVFKAKPLDLLVEKELAPGQFFIDNNRVVVKCGRGFLEILELQPESKKRLSASEFLNGYLPSIEKYQFEN